MKVIACRFDGIAILEDLNRAQCIPELATSLLQAQVLVRDLGDRYGDIVVVRDEYAVNRERPEGELAKLSECISDPCDV